MQTTLTADPYAPATPLTGGEISVIYRGKNMMPKGLPPQIIYQAYPGSLDLNETIPSGSLTGTLSFDPTSNLITGAGTNFFSELHIGSGVFASNGEFLIVIQIISSTQFRNGRLPFSTQTVATATIAPILFAVDVMRGSLLHGNAIQFDKGTILCVGSGVLRLNGVALPGDSLTASRRAQVALYNASTNTYDVQDIGFDDVPDIANTDISVTGSGGTKNMSLGFYSFKVAYYSTITTGYGNPTPTLLLDDITGYEVTDPNSTFDFDFSGDTPPAKADGYIIYGSAYAGSSDISKVNAIQGGWFQIGNPIPFTALAGGHYVFDYTDNDLSVTVAFDNDPPPDAEYVVSLDRYPFMISTNGRGVNEIGREKETSPGAFVSPIKAENFDAYPNPYKVPTEKGEVIIGSVSAAGRIFVLTGNTLQAVTPTGIPQAPFTCRPFWKRGFQAPYNLTFLDDTLYGFTTQGMYRSIAQGDEGSESNEFAAGVETQTAKWHGAYTFVEHDAQNEHICFFQSAIRQNDEGYWETDILPYSLRQQQFVPTIVLSSPTRDMIVSGTASVGGHLCFIAGGRKFLHGGDIEQWDTFQYAGGSADEVNWYLAWNFKDTGVELIPKILRNLRPKGKFTSAKIQVYIVTPDSDIDITDLETGANPTIEFNLDDSTVVKQYKIFKHKIKNALMWTLRIEGTSIYAVDEIIDQLHEIALTVDVSGAHR